MKKYLAFISYRHLPDSTDAALRIRKGLEGYHLPAGCSLPKRRRVFRDNDELPTSSDLGMDIENALRDSEYLIALCSEEYMQSKWCLREMETFIESGRKDRILPVLLSGMPETSVPKEIRDLPVAADLRTGTDGCSYERRKVKPAIPQLLGAMSEMDPDRIAGAELKFRTFAAAAAVSILAAGLLGFAGYASHTAERIAENNVLIVEAAEQTEKEEQQALKERDTALLRQSEYLARQAWKAIEDDDTDTAIRLALEALPEDLHGDLPVSPEAEGVLRVALSMEMPPSYHLSYTAETDFDIRSYYIYPYIDDKIMLMGERFEEAQPYVDYMGETGRLVTDFSESRQKAIGLGYTGLIHLAGDVNARRHYYYGPGGQMYCENPSGYYRMDFTLNGEPFCAAGAVQDENSGDLVAWEDPGARGNPRTVLFDRSSEEALAVLEGIEGIPVSVSFPGNYTFICIVDQGGTLHVYDTKGVKVFSLQGEYTDVYYYYRHASFACLGSADGSITILDIDNRSEVLTFSCPSPVRQVRVCLDRNCVLARCDSGVYLYHIISGNLITEIGQGAVPNCVLWKNDRGNNSPDPAMIILLYDRRVELYSIDRDIDPSVADYLPLFCEGVPYGSDMSYSQDGKRIFQHSYTGNFTYDPGQDIVFCWDAYTGELLWESANPLYCYESLVKPGTDGKTLWRIYEGRGETGIEQLDGMSGRTLYSVSWPGEFWQLMSNQPVESPDGSRAFLTMQKSRTNLRNCTEMVLVFDTDTGSLLWRLDLEEDSALLREKNEAEAGTFLTVDQLSEKSMVLPEERTGMAEAAFSRDGKYLYCVQNAVRKETGETGVCVDRLDAETGEILDERFLAMGKQEITMWEEEEALVLVDEKADEINRASYSVLTSGEWTAPYFTGAVRDVTVDHTVRIFDLAKWDLAAVIPFSYLRSPEAYNQPLRTVRPFAGGMGLYWETENSDGDGEDYCCRLEKDGSLGPVYAADSEEGRRLWVSKENHLIFSGEDAFLAQDRIVRLSDGALLLQKTSTSGIQTIQYGDGPLYTVNDQGNGIDAAKDGSSICISSSSRASFLILPSDLDTLVEKGKRRIEMKKQDRFSGRS